MKVLSLLSLALPCLVLLSSSPVSLSLPVSVCVSATSLGAGACFASNYADDYSAFEDSHGVQSTPGSGAYTIQISSPTGTYLPGCTYTVSICGYTPFAGFMLYSQYYASDATNALPTRSGVLTPAASLAAVVKAKECDGSLSSTLTHVSPALKGPSLDFAWTAPALGADRMSAEQDGAQIQEHEMQAWIVRTGGKDNWFNVAREVQLDESAMGVNAMGPFACPARPATACTTSNSGVAPVIVDPPVDHGGHGEHTGGGGSDSEGVVDGGDGGHAGHGSSTGEEDGHDMDMGMDMTMDMSMVFSTKWHNRRVLFNEWKISSTQIYVVSLIGVFLFAAIFEAIQVGSGKLDQNIITAARKKQRQTEEQREQYAHYMSRQQHEYMHGAHQHQQQQQQQQDGSQSAQHQHLMYPRVDMASPPPPLAHAASSSSSSAASPSHSHSHSHAYHQHHSHSHGHGSGEAAAHGACNTATVSVSSLLPSSSPTSVTLSSTECATLAALQPYYFTPREQALRTFVYLCKSFGSLLIMLIFMSMDVGFVLAVLLGMATGFALYQNNSGAGGGGVHHH